MKKIISDWLINNSGSFIIAFLTAFFAFYFNEKSRKRIISAEKEARIYKIEANKANAELAAMTVFYTSKMSELLEEVENHIFNNTKASSFSMWFAVNGKEDFNKASVFYSSFKLNNQNKECSNKYKKVNIDYFTKKVIKQARDRGFVLLNTNHLPKDSQIFEFSIKEKRLESVIKYVETKKYDSNNDVVIFATIGNYENSELTLDELLEIRNAVDKLRTEARYNITIKLPEIDEDSNL